jgi:hypothetical protein
MGGPVEVYSARNAAEARFVANLLSDAGVEAMVVGEALGMAIGELPPGTATPRVWVRPEDEVRARPVVAEYQHRLIERVTQGRRETYCYHCGHEVDPGQSPCPICCRDLEWDQHSV